MTNEQRAKEIAAKANECCNRSDDFEERIYQLALKYINDATNDGYRRGEITQHDFPRGEGG